MAKRFYIAYGSNLNLPQMRGRTVGGRPGAGGCVGGHSGR